MNTDKNTVIFYHGGCTDGFGGAFAAWKKYGDSAEYIPLSRGEEPPVETARGKEVFFVDFTYTKDVMDRFVETAGSITVLDHHEGVEDVITAMPKFVYDSKRSGAGIAWDFFHEGEPRPQLLNHVEDDDLFRFTIPDTREIITYLEVQPFTFEAWDTMATALDSTDTKERMLEKARTYREYFELLALMCIEKAKLVSFEGYEVYFAVSHPIRSMRSLIGNELAKKRAPLALVVSAHPEGYGVSIRGDGSVNVAKIAEKFGGNGHPDAAGFLIPREGPFPWNIVEKEADE